MLDRPGPGRSKATGRAKIRVTWPLQFRHDLLVLVARISGQSPRVSKGEAGGVSAARSFSSEHDCTVSRGEDTHLCKMGAENRPLRRSSD
jgi:hypothetical protein